MLKLTIMTIAKNKPLVIGAIVVVAIIAGYFLVTGIQLRQAELGMMEEFQKPKARLGFWNKSNTKILLKISAEDGAFEWAPLPIGGGSYASHDVGKIRIERISDDKSIYSVDIVLREGGEAKFNVYENRIEPE